MLDVLRERFQAVGDRRETIETEAATRVKTWLWTTPNSVRWQFQLFYGERIGDSGGRILASAPDRLDEVDAYGYDEHGRLALARLYRRPVGAYAVVIVEHDGPRSWTTMFEIGGRLNRVGLVERDEQGRIAAVTEYQDGIWWSERYVWHEGRVTEIHKRHSEADLDRPELRVVEYDEHGDLIGIRLGDAYEYRRPDTDIRTALRRFEQSLPVAVELAVGDRRPFALALQYDVEQPLPPTLIAGSREDWAAGPNPAEWDGPELPLPFDALGIEPGVLAGAVGREGAEEEARSALNRAARQLNKTPPRAWGDDPPVVYAVDLHEEQLDENLREAVPAARRRRLGLA